MTDVISTPNNILENYINSSKKGTTISILTAFPPANVLKCTNLYEHKKYIFLGVLH